MVESDSGPLVELARNSKRVDSAGGMRIFLPWNAVLAPHEIDLLVGDVVRPKYDVEILNAEQAAVVAWIVSCDKTRAPLVIFPLERGRLQWRN